MMLSKERILELAAQAEDFAYMTAISGEECQEAYTKKFALLIVNECKEVMQLALESLIEAKVVAERYQNAKKREQAITALREALDHSGEANEMVVGWDRVKPEAIASDPLYQQGFVDGVEEGRNQVAEQAEQEPFLEVFCDPSYFDMWCVRDVHDKDYNHTIHVNSKETANHAKALIENWVKKYAAPVRTKDLTDDEIETAKHCLPRYLAEITDEDLNEFARVVIAADREKNK